MFLQTFNLAGERLPVLPEGRHARKGCDMIKLSRLDGEQFILNADLIRYVESRPDTFITLTSGERLVVTETMDEVLERAVRYQQTKHLVPGPITRQRTTATAVQQNVNN